MSEPGQLKLYLSEKDSLDLRYLTEHDFAIRQHSGELSADEATAGAAYLSINRYWTLLDTLELFSKYDSVVVTRDENGTDEEFDWSIVCDSEDFQPPDEPNTSLGFSQQDFILLEASLRRTAWYVTNGRYPERDEIFRIALRFDNGSKEHKPKKSLVLTLHVD